MQHSEEEILALHRKYAASDAVFELIYTHCQIVRDIALDLIEISRLPLDIELVTTGAMVHDIGVYELFNANGTLKPNMHYIQHVLRVKVFCKTKDSQKYFVDLRVIIRV